MNSTELPKEDAEVSDFFGGIETKFAAVLAADMMYQIKLSEVNDKARRECRKMNGTYIRKLLRCIQFKPVSNGTSFCQAKTYQFNLFSIDMRDQKGAEYWIYLIGNVLSMTSMAVLFMTYVFDRELHTSYGNCIILLSVNTMLQQTLQMVSINAKNDKQRCKAIAVLHHWSYLVMFSWMGSIAFDFSVTFSQLRRPTLQMQRHRFKVYALVSELAPTIFVAICIGVDFGSNNEYIGYGVGGICFVTNYKANILAFSLPLACIIIFNIICLSVTLTFIAKTRRSSRAVLGKNSNRRKRGHMVIVVMALKLSLLLGIGWVFGPIGRLTQSKTVVQIYIFISTFQGFFIFGAFCVNQKVFHFYCEKIRVAFIKFHTVRSVDHTEETDF